MLHILYGSDNYSLHLAFERIIKAATASSAIGVDTLKLEGDQLSIADLKFACETVPFLAEKRIVVIYGLLARFEFSRKIASTKNSLGKAPDWVPMAECINRLPETTILLLIDGDITSRNPLLKEISGSALVQTFPLIKRRAELSAWIQKRVPLAGGRITAPAADLMATLVGHDLWAMSNEIDKLVAYASGHPIEERDIKAVVSHAQEANIFNVVDAVMNGQISTAETALQDLLSKGSVPTYVLYMLHRQVSLIVLAKELTNQKKTKAEMQARLGLSDFPLQKTLDQANRFSMERLKRAYKKLLETDLAIKRGEYFGDLALNILVIELSLS